MFFSVDNPVLFEVILAMVIVFSIINDFFIKKLNYEIILMVSTLGLLSLLFYQLLHINVERPSTTILFEQNYFTDLFRFILYLGTVISMYISRRWLSNRDDKRSEFILIHLGSVIGLSLMISSVNFMALFVASELYFIASCFLVSYKKNDDNAIKASLKYYIYGVIFSIFMAYGLVLLYINIGSLNYKEVAFHFSQIDKLKPIEIWAITLIICSILHKIAIVPFHNWYAQTIKGSASVISIHFTALSSITMICVLTKIISFPFKPIASYIVPVILFLSIISMIIGAVMAANQKNIKKLLCYSSIHHVGFVLIGICIFNEQSILASLIYLSIYAFSYIFLYICLLSFRSKDGYVEYLEDLSGLSETKQYLSAAILLSLLTLIGVPPLIGYLGRFFIINSLISTHLYWVAVVVIISVAINSYAYLKIIKVIYFEKDVKKFKETDSNLSILLILITIISIYLMLDPDILVNIFEPAINRLMIG